MSEPVCAQRAPYAVELEAGDYCLRWQAQVSGLRRLQSGFRFVGSDPRVDL